MTKKTNTCETCAFWTSRRPTEKQAKVLEAEYEKLHAAAEAKRAERNELQDKMRSESWERPRSFFDDPNQPIVTNRSGWGDDVWRSEAVQKLHKEREALAQASYRVREKLHLRHEYVGECRSGPPSLIRRTVNLGIFGQKVAMHSGWPKTNIDDACACYSFKDGL